MREWVWVDLASFLPVSLFVPNPISLSYICFCMFICMCVCVCMKIIHIYVIAIKREDKIAKLQSMITDS